MSAGMYLSRMGMAESFAENRGITANYTGPALGIRAPAAHCAAKMQSACAPERGRVACTQRTALSSAVIGVIAARSRRFLRIHVAQGVLPVAVGILRRKQRAWTCGSGDATSTTFAGRGVGCSSERCRLSSSTMDGSASTLRPQKSNLPYWPVRYSASLAARRHS